MISEGEVQEGRRVEEVVVEVLVNTSFPINAIILKVIEACTLVALKAASLSQLCPHVAQYFIPQNLTFKAPVRDFWFVSALAPPLEKKKSC